MQQHTSTTPRAEEHAARTRHKALQRAQAGTARADQRRRAQIIREHLASPSAEACRCPITPPEVRALGAGCTAGRWVRPTLDAIRRRLGT